MDQSVFIRFLVSGLITSFNEQEVEGSRLEKTVPVISAVLDRGLHPADVDSFSDQQLFGVTHGRWRRLGRAGKNPGVVDVEEVEEAGARVNHGQAGVVGGQNPVGSVRSD